MPLPGFRDQSRLPDFEVVVIFLSAKDGGRKSLPHQGYRPDMGFADESKIWVINPEFLRDDGAPYSLDESVPRSVRANMYVITPEARPLVRDFVRIGQTVRMVEGRRTVACGEVVQIKNLLNDPS
jgi:hypothetical protein